MAQKTNVLQEKKVQIEKSILTLFKSFSIIERQIGIWQDIGEGADDIDLVREKIRNWESSEQERNNVMKDLESAAGLIGRIPKNQYLHGPDFDQISDYERKKVVEEERARERNLSFLSIKPSKLISIYYNPMMREDMFKQKIEFMVNSNHNYMAYFPKDKPGETTKICTLLHAATLTVCNMTLETLSVKPNSGSPNHLILTDLSFHMLLEPLASQSTPEKLDADFIQTNYHVVKRSGHPSEILKKLLGSKDINIEFRQTSSTLDMYNLMSKLVRNKYKSAGSTGTANVAALMERVFQYIERYLSFLPKMMCTKCERGVLFDVRTNTFCYPFFNHGEMFFHQSCAPEDVVNYFM